VVGNDREHIDMGLNITGISSQDELLPGAADGIAPSSDSSRIVGHTDPHQAIG